jgi:hypothetical protein
MATNDEFWRTTRDGIKCKSKGAELAATGKGLNLIGSGEFGKKAAAVTRDGLTRRSVYLFSVVCL